MLAVGRSECFWNPTSARCSDPSCRDCQRTRGRLSRIAPREFFRRIDKFNDSFPGRLTPRFYSGSNRCNRCNPAIWASRSSSPFSFPLHSNSANRVRASALNFVNQLLISFLCINHGYTSTGSCKSLFSPLWSCLCIIFTASLLIAHGLYEYPVRLPSSSYYGDVKSLANSS
jgi:hypothetical protein